MTYYFGLIIAGVFGAIFGSYCTLFAHRIPINESCFGRYFGPKSRCPECGTIIRTRDLVPLINWLFTLGRCSSCRAKIPRSHLFIEIATTISFMFCYMKFSFSEEFLLYSLLSAALILLVVIDYKHKLFPNQVLNVVFIIGLVNRVLVEQSINNVIFSSALGFVFATIFYQIFYKRAASLLVNQDRALSYTKFIIIASVSLSPIDFLLYFLSVILIFIFLLFVDKSLEVRLVTKAGKKRSSKNLKKSSFTFGFSLVIPFIWLIFYPV